MKQRSNKKRRLISGTDVVVVGRAPRLSADVGHALLHAHDWRQEMLLLLAVRPEILTAIRVASRGLYEALSGDGGSPPDRVLLKALMYVLRMSARATPFGQFAGIGDVEVGPATDLKLDSASFRTVTRPDMGWFSSWLSAVSADLDANSNLPLTTNDMQLRMGDRMWVLNRSAAVDHHDAQYEFQRSVVDWTDGVDFVLQCSFPITQRALARLIAEEFDAEPERCITFVRTLQRVGLLQSALAPAPIGDVFGRVRRHLEATESHEADVATVLAALRRVDETGLSDRTADDYASAEAALHAIHPSKSSPIQVDMAGAFSGTLGQDVVNEAARLAEMSLRMCPPRRRLDTYREKFAAHFEGTDARIPLLELADPEFGLGKPLVLDGFVPEYKTQRKITDLAIAATREGIHECILSDDDFDGLYPELQADATVPQSLELGFSVFAPSAEAVNAGQYLIAPTGLATNAAGRTLGRFFHLLSPATTVAVRGMLQEQSDDGPVPAELLYVPPDHRFMNVCTRPRLLDHELQIGCTAEGAIRRLDVRRILVGIRDGKFYLWSAEIGREISVVQTHVLGVGPNIPSILALLIALQGEGERLPVAFPWGFANDFTFLPRVRVGRIILTLARWRINLAELRAASSAEAYLGEFRRKWNVPNNILIAEGDNMLPVNLDHATAIPLLLRSPKVAEAVLVENLAVGDGLWLTSARGRHVSEFVASFRVDAERPKSAPTKHRIVETEPRCASLADGWVYLRLRCAPKDTDTILNKWRQFFTSAATRNQQGIESWFFLRYAAPAYHIRLRLRAKPGQWRHVLNQAIDVASRLERAALISSYAIDTYHREIERYGGPEALTVVERLFAADSRRYLDLTADGAITESNVFDETCFDALTYLATLLGPDAISDWLAQQPRQQKLSQHDRAVLRSLRERALNDPCLQARSDVEQDAEALRELRAEGKLRCPFFEIVSALLHMHFNRFGCGAHETRGRTLLNAALSAVRQARSSGSEVLV